MSSAQIVVKLPRSMNKDIEEIASEEMMSKSAEIRKLIAVGMQKSKLEKGISMYLHNRAGISKAAKLAGLPLIDFVEELNDRGIIINKEFTPEYLDKTWNIMKKV